MFLKISLPKKWTKFEKYFEKYLWRTSFFESWGNFAKNFVLWKLRKFCTELHSLKVAEILQRTSFFESCTNFAKNFILWKLHKFCKELHSLKVEEILRKLSIMKLSYKLSLWKQFLQEMGISCPNSCDPVKALICAHSSHLCYTEWIIRWYQKFTLQSSTMSLPFKNYSLVQVIYLCWLDLIRLSSSHETQILMGMV